jgi:anti-sigma factor RsiW
MDCQELSLHVLDYQRGRLPTALRGDVRAHLDACPSCSQAAASEAVLTELLEQRLPQHPASLALKRKLAAAWPNPAAPREERSRGWGRDWLRALVPAAAVAAVLLVMVPVYRDWQTGRSANEASLLVAEAVTDHLRGLSSRPLGIESGGLHQVRPWFAGRLDFAPVVSFEGDAEFPLKGGAVEYFLDRKAAVFVYGRRLHTISLFVVRAEGLPWPASRLTPLGRVQAYRTTSRGFAVILWRAGELGYALVSDVDPAELGRLAEKLTGAV